MSQVILELIITKQGCPLIIYSCTSCSYSLSGSHLGCPAVGRPQILCPGGSITSQWGLLGPQHWWYPTLSLSPEPVKSTKVLCVRVTCQSNNIPAHTRLSIWSTHDFYLLLTWSQHGSTRRWYGIGMCTWKGLGLLPTRVPPGAASEQVWCNTEGDIREVLRLVFTRGTKCE